MIALGWTLRGATAPEPAAVIDLADCAVVAAPASAGASPSGCLGLQVACARRLDAFLPMRPGARVPLDLAVDLGRRHGAAVAAGLEDLRGHVQLSLRAEMPVRGPHDAARAEGGRLWLATRAARLAAEETCSEELAARLRRIRTNAVTRSAVERAGPGAMQLALLCRADAADAALDEIERMLARIRWPDGTRLALTGPWPALAFAGVIATGRAA
jgi:hypothetical protein